MIYSFVKRKENLHIEQVQTKGAYQAMILSGNEQKTFADEYAKNYAFKKHYGIKILNMEYSLLFKHKK